MRDPSEAAGQAPGQAERIAALDASALLDRLRHHALGVADMTSTQVRAAEVALKKAEAADKPENRAVRNTVSAEPLSEDEWQRRYAR